MSLSHYLASRIWEMLLVYMGALSMSMVCFNAFYLRQIDDVQIFYAAPIVLVLVLACFVAARDRQHLAGGIVGVAALCMVTLFVSLAVSTGENPWADQAGNYLYFGAVVVVFSLLSFLLSRKTVGCVIWLVVCTVLCALVQAMYQMDEYLFSFLAVVTALVLVAYRNARRGALSAQVSQKSTPFSSFVYALIPTVFGLAAGLAVWFLVIAPLNPGTVPIVLLTEYRHLPTVVAKGIADIDPLINTDYTTNNLEEGQYFTTDDLVEDENSDVEVKARDKDEARSQSAVSESQGSGAGGGATSGAHDTPDPESDDEEFERQGYSDTLPWVLLWALALALVAAAIVAFFLLRRRARLERLRELLAGSKAEQLSALYLFLLGKLGRIGFKMPEGQTMGEWSFGNARRMDIFTEESGVSFGTLTSAYAECCAYGRREPTDTEITQATAFYLSFWKAARAYLGNIRYFFKSFRL